MMKLAVLGAPDAGKTAFAAGLKNYLGTDWTVIDNYVQEVEILGDVALRHHMATYLGNLHIASERILEEAQADGDSITVGTIVETMVYTTIWTVMARQVTGNAADYARGIAALELMSIVLRDTWDYDLAFYLPYPVNEANDDSLDAEVNANILVTLKAFDLPYIMVTEDYTSEQAAAEVIKVQSEAKTTK